MRHRGRRQFALASGPGRLTVAVAVLLLAALATASVAGARTITGTAKANTLKGTSQSDVILGLGGADRLYGAGGRDKLAGGSGRDTIRCGGGYDTVMADAADRVAADCENVLRPTVSSGGQVAATTAAKQPTAPSQAPPVQAAPDATDPGHQHGEDEGHLLGDGASGKIEFLGKVEIESTRGGSLTDLVADVAVSPDGNTAFLANWGEDTCADNSERGGINAPDAGAWVIDISDIEESDPVAAGADAENAEVIGFIPHSQDSRPGEGMQVIEVTTSFFSGDVLVMNNEDCGPNFKGGVSLWDVTNPAQPKKLSEHFGDRSALIGDVNTIHSAFAWDAGDNAYVVMTDNEEFPDVDIMDITNPHRPRLIAELDLNELFDVDQPEIGLTDSFLHDMVVKFMEDGPYAGHWVMLLSYWDGGWVLLNVDDPANPTLLGEFEYPEIDPQLAESFPGVELTPEGNAHQAEFTIDNRFIIGTDEDFAPYRPDEFRITTGPNAGVYPAVIVPGGAAPAILDDLTLNGPVVYGGYGCPDSAPIPSPEDIPGYLAMLAPGEETIIVLQRGPVGDPSAPEEACFPGEKAHEAALAGWDAVLFVNHHTGEAAGGEPFCGSGAFVDEIVAVCTTHAAFHRLFGLAPLNPPWTYPENLAIGTIGQEIEVGSVFDGWGYVWLIDAETLEPLDTYAIPESQDPDFAFGHGDLSVHEVAVDPQDETLAYLSYYAGGLRAIQIQCTNPADTSTCELVEVGGYLDPDGNDFWGVETFVGEDGQTYILGSDRDSGLWIFRDP
jgi:hypothetical protein